MYNCTNVVTEKADEPCAVLIRALEPVDGIEDMCIDRYGKVLENITKKQYINLANGPGKLSIAMSLTRKHNNISFNSENLFICENENIPENMIVKTKRINIDYAEEAKDFLWRYYIKGNKYVSKK